MNLYDISDAYFDILQRIEDAEGEIDEELEAELDRVTNDRETKLKNYARIIFNWRAQVEACKNEQARLYKRQKSYESKVNSLMYILDKCLAPGEKYEDECCKISRRKAEKVEIVDEAELPDIFCNFRTVKTPDKKEIKQTIKEGGEVPGAKLVLNNHLQVK